jgi:hypothetical protein
MIVPWNPLVNNRFNLEGDYGPNDGYITTLEFASGKKRIMLTNSYVPPVYPSLSLLLDNIHINENQLTEYEEFTRWFNDNLRYGTLSFSCPRIGFRPTVFTKTGETGIYEFIPHSLKYEDMGGLITVVFGLEEKGYLPGTEYLILSAGKGKALLADKNTYIVLRRD